MVIAVAAPAGMPLERMSPPGMRFPGWTIVEPEALHQPVAHPGSRGSVDEVEISPFARSFGEPASAAAGVALRAPVDDAEIVAACVHARSKGKQRKRHRPECGAGIIQEDRSTFHEVLRELDAIVWGGG